MQSSSTHSVRSHESGMSLSEALISILLLSMMMVAFLGLLDTTSRVSKVQNNIADSTENIRFSMAALVRLVRMAGTGGLPIVRNDGSGWVEFALQVWDDNDLVPGLLGGKTPVANSDVILVRGLMVSEIYEIAGETMVDFTANTIRIPDRSPYDPSVQQLLHHPTNLNERPVVLSTTEFLDINTGVGGVRHYAGYRVVEVNSGDSDPVVIDSTPDADGVTWMTIKIKTDGGSTSVNPGGTYVEPETRQIYSVGFMDEVYFFVAMNDANEPSLYRWLGDGNADEVVSNIAAIQVALGCDLNADNVVGTNEWFLTKDQATKPSNDQLNTLREVRISVVSRSAAPERDWDEKAQMPENMAPISGDELMYRHRVITVNTVLRSHPPLEAI